MVDQPEATPLSAASADTRKRVRKAAAAASATAQTAVAAAAVASERAAAEATSVAFSPVSTEAAPSPAISSDDTPRAAPPAPIAEETGIMATVAAPTTPAEGVEKAQAMFGDASSRFKSAFDKSSKVGEDMVEFAKGNMEAFVASARVAAKAGESLGQEAAEFGKRQFEGATAAFKSFASVKSPTELFQLQSDYAKSSFDSAVAEASRMSESMLKLAGDIAQPLSNRYAVAAEKFKSASL